MKKFNQLYDKNIYNLVDELKTHSKINSPNFIATGLGDNCGDFFELQVNSDGTFLEISCESNSCMITNASYCLMNKIITGLSVKDIKKLCKNALKSIPQNNFNIDSRLEQLSIFKNMPSHRISCVLLPWEIMLEATELILANNRHNKSEAPATEDASLLDCDSCIKVKTISSSESKQKATKSKSIDYLSNAINHSNKELLETEKAIKKLIGINPLLLGKFYLNDKELNNVKILVDNWTDDFTYYFRKSKMIGIIGGIIENELSIPMPESLYKIYNHQKTHNKMSFELWDRVQNVLTENNIPFSAIKGISTAKLYKKYNRNRFFSDMDILVPDFEKFIHVINKLRYTLNFNYHDMIGLAGSLKYSKNTGISGHTHLLYFSNNQMFTIDLSFPHIPNGIDKILNVDIEYTGNNNSYENLFIIAVAHAFKHSRPPIKDILDCYILLNEESNYSFDYDYVLKKIKNNQMEKKLELIRLALNKHFPDSKLKGEKLTNSSLTLKDKLIIKAISLIGWPYSKLSHQLFRSYEIISSKNIKQSNEDEVDKQINDLYSYVRSQAPNRVYLFPLMSVHTIINLRELSQSLNYSTINNSSLFYSINDGKYIITEYTIFALTPDIQINFDTGENWNKTAELILNEAHISKEDIDVHFKYDKESKSWIYE